MIIIEAPEAVIRDTSVRGLTEVIATRTEVMRGRCFRIDSDSWGVNSIYIILPSMAWNNAAVGNK